MTNLFSLSSRSILGGILFNFMFFCTSTIFGQASINIMPLGDSITKGTGSTSGTGFRSDLATLLNNEGVNFTFVGSLIDAAGNHEGHNGWPADSIDFHINDYLNASNPDLILLHIGTNDISGAESNTTIISDISSIVDKIYNFNNSCIILICSLIPRTDLKDAQTTDLNQSIETLIIDKRNLGYIIYYVGQNEIFKANPNWVADYMSDTLHPNDTGYNIMAEVYFNAIMVAINSSGSLVTDNFNRTQLGITWDADQEFQIVVNELSNTSATNSWGFVAVYRAQQNPDQVSFKWGTNADAAGIDQGGFALMLDGPTPDANGYLLFRRTGGNPGTIDLWTIENGVPGHAISSINGLLANPVAGDEFKVILSTDGGGHHFDCFINGQFDGRVSDTAKEQGNSAILYAGVKLKGALNNNIDDFNIIKSSDETPPAAVINLAVGLITATSIQLTWTAPGDDSTQGTASSYDLRYSTSPINEINFQGATRVTGTPTPSSPGTLESFIIGNLQPNTIYYFALKTLDEANNTSPISNVPSASTLSGFTFVDDFNRSELGSDWIVDPEYQIVSGELSNTSTVDQWGFMAIYMFRKNPLDVSLKWGVGANANGIDGGGFALMLDSPSLNANGYLVWKKPSEQKYFLWTIENGVPGQSIAQIAASLPGPTAGDVFKVVIRSDDSGNHFDCFINGQFDVTISDVNKLQGNTSPLYAGVMLRGGRSNNIDDFTLTYQVGNPSNLVKLFGDNQEGIVGKTLPDSMVIMVSDEIGNPVPNVGINFDILEGNGSIRVVSSIDKIRIEAESGILTPPMEIAQDLSASNGNYIWVPVGAGNNGVAEYTFTVSNSGTFVIWGRAIAPSGSEDSFFISMDNGADVLWDVLQGSWQNNWTWNQVSDRGTGSTTNPQFNPKLFELNAGTHTLKVKRRDPGTKLDLIIITNDLSFVPTGLEESNGLETDTNGKAFAFLTLGTTAGINTVQVSSAGLIPVNFTATGMADSAETITKISGDVQSAPPGTQLPNPFVVALQDQYGNLVANFPVNWDVITGNGTLSSPNPVFTDTNGQASNTLTMATNGPINEVLVTAPGVVGDSVIFRATAEPGDPATLIVLSGDDQVGQANQVLPESLSVKISDVIGTPKSNHPVTFEVKSGGGTLNDSLSIITINTNSNGIAAVSWTLGPELGAQNTVEVSSSFSGNPLNNSPHTFQATALAPSILTKESGDNQTGTANKALSQPFVVKVSSNDGTPVAGVEVTFTVTGGGGNFSGTSSTIVLSNDLGIAEAILTLGPTPGTTNTAQATASFNGNPLTGSPIDFTANSAVPQTLVRVTEDTLIGPVNSPLDSIEVQVLDALSNPLGNWDVIFTVTLGGGKVNDNTIDTVQTDVNGIARAEWTLGGTAADYNNKLEASATYNSSPLNGSPIEFVASAVPGSAAVLEKVSGDSLYGVIQNPLLKPFVVRVTDGTNPVQGWPVTFKVIDGGGNINGLQDTTINTNAMGEAAVTLTLGSISGVWNNRVEASAENAGNPLTNSPLIFVASAAASNASTLSLLSSITVDGEAGEPVAELIQVKVTDSQSNSVENHPVRFTVMLGEGTLYGSTDTVIVTDANGIASAAWHLGCTVGENAQKLEVSANDGINPLANSPIEIFANVAAGQVNPDTSSLIANPNEVPADGIQKATITITLTDKCGNPVSGKAVIFTSSDASDIIIQPIDPTDENGQAVGTIASMVAGLKTIRARDVTDQLDINTTTQVTFTPLSAKTIEEGSGNNQTGNVGTALLEPIVAVVRDKNSNPVPGVNVEFVVTGGGGFLLDQQGVFHTNIEILTDSLGRASATWVLGQNPTENTAEARAPGLIGSPVHFKATGVITSATSMELYPSNNPDRIIVGGTLPEPLRVKIKDVNGYPVWNVPVTFTVLQGEGSVSNENSTTDYQGIAQTNFKVDQKVGTNIVEASNPSLSGSPVTFTFESVVGTPAILKEYAGNGGHGVVNSLYTVTIEIIDIYENPVPGAHAAFEVIGESGTKIESAQNTTDQFGRASAQVRLPTTVGTVQIKATSNDLPDFFVTFTIFVISSNATNIAEFSGNVQNGTVGRELVYPLKVIVMDMYGNPVSGQQVSWVAQGGSSVNPEDTFTNDEGIASTVFTIANLGENQAVAIALGLVGSPVDFIATGVSNNFPLFVDLMDTSVVEGQLLEFKVNATDADGDPITYEAENVPAGASFDGNTRTFSWVPGNQDQGEYLVTFIARDNQDGFDAETIIITVNNSNNPPVINFFTPPDSELVSIKGSTILFSVDATDPDGDSLTFRWESNGDLVSTTNQYEFRTESITTGSYIITVEISDNQDPVRLKWKIDIVTSIELASFTAQFVGFKGVEIKWTTSREHNTRGFNILRSNSRNGEFTKINDDLIPSIGKGEYRFSDSAIKVNMHYFYILEDVDIRGVKTQHGPISLDIAAPKTYELTQNYPNPFNPETKIRYQLPEVKQVVIKIYNILGREVKTLVNERKEPGYHVVTWDATDNFGIKVSSGIYYYQIIAGSFHETKKMLLMK